jgi:DNA-binding transcriptional LysR family regulator
MTAAPRGATSGHARMTAAARGLGRDLPSGGIHAVFPHARHRPRKTRAFVDLLKVYVAQADQSPACSRDGMCATSSSMTMRALRDR